MPKVCSAKFLPDIRIDASPYFRADILAIGDRLATEAGKSLARAFVLGLREKCLELRRMPERFELLKGFEEIRVRRRVHGNYLIVYRVRNDEVEVLRVFHGARDYEELIANDQRLFQ